MNPHLGEAEGWVLLPVIELGVGKGITVNQREAFHTLGIIILESRGNVQYSLNGNETAYGSGWAMGDFNQSLKRSLLKASHKQRATTVAQQAIRKDSRTI